MTAIPPDWLTRSSSASVDARHKLRDALGAALAPVPVYLTQPADLAVPCVFLGLSDSTPAQDNGAPVWVVAFPVVAVIDGANESQVIGLDYMGDRIADVAAELGATSARRAVELDVGGPRLHASTSLVELAIYRATLCARPSTPPYQTPELDLELATTNQE